MTAWFKRKKQGIYTETKDKKDLPPGLWHKCKNCSHLILSTDFEKSFFVCEKCDHHEKINSTNYFKIVFDKEKLNDFLENIGKKSERIYETIISK